MKTLTLKHHKVEEMASEYRFDYKKAKPNRFAQKMNLSVGWTVERFVEEHKEEKPKSKTSSPNEKAAANISSANGRRAPAKKKPSAKVKILSKKKSVPKKKASKPTKKKTKGKK